MGRAPTRAMGANIILTSCVKLKSTSSRIYICPGCKKGVFCEMEGCAHTEGEVEGVCFMKQIR